MCTLSLESTKGCISTRKLGTSSLPYGEPRPCKCYSSVCVGACVFHLFLSQENTGSDLELIGKHHKGRYSLLEKQWIMHKAASITLLTAVKILCNKSIGSWNGEKEGVIVFQHLRSASLYLWSNDMNLLKRCLNSYRSRLELVNMGWDRYNFAVHWSDKLQF